MKTYLSVFLVIVCFSLFSQTTNERPAPDAVVVKVLNVPLPHEESKRAEFLWETFANKPEEKQFNHYTTEKWKDNFAVFSKSLIQKAKDQNLDIDSLRKILDLVLKHSKGKIAYLPVGAYQTTLDGSPVWIITVKWEYPSKDEALSLGHIRMFAFDQKTTKQVAFNTCM